MTDVLWFRSMKVLDQTVVQTDMSSVMQAGVQELLMNVSKNTEHRSTEEENNRVGKFNKMERLDPEVHFTESVTHEMSNKEELPPHKEIYQERL